MRQTYPGQLVQIRKNVFNVLFVLDFSRFDQLKIIEDVFSFIENQIPIRFGIVPIVADNTCKIILK